MNSKKSIKEPSGGHEREDEWSEVTRGERYIMRTTSEETNGAHSMLEDVAAPRSGVAMHVHDNEEEHFSGTRTCCHLSRRGFIGGAAALGLASALFAKPAAAAPTATLIDTHHHFFPPAYQKAWLQWEAARGIPHFPSQVAWSKSKAIEEIDEAGVRTAVLSIASTPGVWFDLDAERASQMARDCNDYAAKWMRKKSGRFGLFAIAVDDRHRPNAQGN